MIKTWRLAWHEYQKHVHNRRFLIGLLSVPLLSVVMIGLIYLVIAMDTNAKPIGYVDHSGLLANPVPPPPVEKPDKPIQMIPFGDEKAAQAALDSGQIQAYYVLPADYRTAGELQVVHIDALKSSSRAQFYNFLATNLLAGTDPVTAKRLTSGAQMVVQSADGTRQISSGDWFSIILPFIAGLAFIIAMFTAGGYLMQAMVEEKENRTMEVIMTSVSPNQFMTGKIVADVAIGLTQILAWTLFIGGVILVGRSSVALFRGIQVSAHSLLLMAVIMLPAFVMVSALMATIGATVAEARDGQQMVGLISIPLWIPYMLTSLIIGSPNSPLVVALSFFPLTAPLTMIIRDAMTILPAWQIIVSSTILVLSAVGCVWLAGRAFRLGMLQYGKRIAWRQLFTRQEGGKQV